MNKLFYKDPGYPNFYRKDTPDHLESGQGILEYALILSFVVVLLVVLLHFFGDQVVITYEMILDSLPF